MSIVKYYVATKSGNARFALESENVIAVCVSAGEPLAEADANSYAMDYVRAEENNAYVFEVEATLLRGFRISKEVVTIATK